MAQLKKALVQCPECAGNLSGVFCSESSGFTKIDGLAFCKGCRGFFSLKPKKLEVENTA